MTSYSARTKQRETAWLIERIGALRGAPVFTLPAALAALEQLANVEGQFVQALKPSDGRERAIAEFVVENIRKVFGRKGLEPATDGHIHDIYTLLRKGYVAR